MHEHDHDLIMALAEGTLPDAEVRTVEAAVAACATCSQELALQQQALHALATATPPRLDDLERQRLRRAVAAAVDLTPVVAPAPQRRRWNIPAIGVAVAAVLVTALAAGPLVNLLSTSGSDDSAGDFAAAATTTTQSAALSAPSSENEVAIAGSPSEGISESSGLSDQSYFDATRESAPNLGAVSDGSLDDLLSKVVEGDPAAAPWVDEDATIATSSRDGVPDCALAVATSFASVRYTALIGTGDAEGAEALVYSVGFEDGSAAVAAVDAATCELVRYRASSRAVTPLGTPQD